MAVTLREYLDSLSQDLNDLNPPGTLPRRWSEAQLLRYFNEAMSHIYALMPSKFMQELLMPLEVGNLQKVCGAGVLHRILGQTDKTGAVIRPIAEYSQELVTRWTKQVCSPKEEGFRISGYTTHPSDNGFFRVYPAVPPNEEVFVKVLYSEPPAPLDARDMNVALSHETATLAAARHWVLFSALMVDDESPAELNAAKGHLEVFFKLLDIEISQYRLLALGVSNKVAKHYATN